jgi:hypothetical protein
MKKILPTICLLLVCSASYGQLLDPCCESSPPWTICEGGSFTDTSICTPPSPPCGTTAYYYQYGDGNIDNGGIYQCVFLSGGTYRIGVHHQMGPIGQVSKFHLRVAPAPMSCSGICSAGTALYTSDVHDCGAWTDSGLQSYTPPSAGTYCLIGVICGNDGWTCGSLIAIDDWTFLPPPAVGDWVLY